MNGDLTQAVLLFAGSAAVVILSGVFLAKYGDALAELMGWGRLWVGTILIAMVTSLPELVTDITAVTRNEPELAAGDLLGSNMANMFILAMVALIFAGGARFFRQVAPEQKFVALIAISLTSLAVLLGAFPIGLSFLAMGLASVLVLAVYLPGMRLVYVTRPQGGEDREKGASGGLPSMRKAWIIFGLASLAVIVAAPALVFSVEEIADITGLSTSFLGVVAVALVTSFPEASATITAVRIGAIDLAVGGLYGSCVFNVLILALADPFYREGVLLETFQNDHLAAGLVAILLMSLGLGQILLRGQFRYAPAVPTLVVMGLVYIGSLFLIYTLG